MAKMSTDTRIARALRDPMVLKLMRRDAEFAEFFDERGNLNRDPMALPTRRTR